MPVCRGCGKNVSCGCQLINGLCSACRKLNKYVTTKTYELFRLH